MKVQPESYRETSEPATDALLAQMRELSKKITEVQREIAELRGKEQQSIPVWDGIGVPF